MKSPDVPSTSARLRVWDIFIRLFHWSLVATMLGAWFSSSIRGEAHQWIGLAAAGLVGFRLIYGLIGSRYARFKQFVKSPLTIFGYVTAIIGGSERRYLGHNPAGGAMVMLLLLAVCATAITGYLMTTDAYYGDDFMQGFHSLCAYGTVGLVLLHIGGVVLASVRHKENLVVAMITGEKREATGNDVA